METAIIVAGYVLCGAMIFLLGIVTGGRWDSQLWRALLVKRGLAQWTVNDDGRTQWAWNEKDKMDHGGTT